MKLRHRESVSRSFSIVGVKYTQTIRLKFKKGERSSHATLDEFHIVKLSPVVDVTFSYCQNWCGSRIFFGSREGGSHLSQKIPAQNFVTSRRKK